MQEAELFGKCLPVVERDFCLVSHAPLLGESKSLRHAASHSARVTRGRPDEKKKRARDLWSREPFLDSFTATRGHPNRSLRVPIAFSKLCVRSVVIRDGAFSANDGNLDPLDLRGKERNHRAIVTTLTS